MAVAGQWSVYLYVNSRAFVGVPQKRLVGHVVIVGDLTLVERPTGLREDGDLDASVIHHRLQCDCLGALQHPILEGADEASFEVRIEVGDAHAGQAALVVDPANYASAASNDPPAYSVGAAIAVIGNGEEPSFTIKSARKAVQDPALKEPLKPLAVSEDNFGSAVKLSRCGYDYYWCGNIFTMKGGSMKTQALT